MIFYHFSNIQYFELTLRKLLLYNVLALPMRPNYLFDCL